MTERVSQLSQKISNTCLRLSDYEKRVYEILLREGPSTATKISVLSNVPRTKVYKVLEKLVEVGMVSEIPLKPKHYIALPPKEALKPILETQKVIQRSIHALISNLQKKYEESMYSGNVVREEFWIFTGQEVLEKASRFLSQAEKNIKIFALNWDVFSKFYSFFSDILTSLTERKVKINLYFSAASNVDQKLFDVGGLRCNFISGPINIPSYLVLLSVDHRYVVACLLTYQSFLPDSFKWIVFRGKTFCRLVERFLLKDFIKPLSIEETFVIGSGIDRLKSYSSE